MPSVIEYIVIKFTMKTNQVELPVGDYLDMTPEAELLAQITDPFVTSRTTRKVGLGIPLFKAAAEACIRELLQEGVGKVRQAITEREAIRQASDRS
jgi:hypothetical protein